MGYALAKENQSFINRMIKRGRFNNQSEVVREALRRMERQEMCYLNPESLSEEEAKRIFAPDTAEDGRELAFAHAALESIRKKR